MSSWIGWGSLPCVTHLFFSHLVLLLPLGAFLLSLPPPFSFGSIGSPRGRRQGCSYRLSFQSRGVEPNDRTSPPPIEPRRRKELHVRTTMATAAMSAAFARGNMHTTKVGQARRCGPRTAAKGWNARCGNKKHAQGTRKRHVVRSVDFEVRRRTLWNATTRVACM